MNFCKFIVKAGFGNEVGKNPGFDPRKGNASGLFLGGMLEALLMEFGPVYTERGGLCMEFYADCIKMIGYSPSRRTTNHAN